MLNKKWMAIFMIMMMAAFGVFAAEEEEEKDGEEKDSIASGFFNFEEESVVNVTAGEFESFETKVKTLEGGVNLNLVDDIGLVLSPFAGVSDVKAVVSPADDGLRFNFDEATTYAGLKLALAPIDMLGLEFALYNVDYFGNKAATLGAAAGLGFSVGLGLEVEQAFLTFEIANALEATWSGVRSPIGLLEFDASKAAATQLYNDFTYGLRFNFFNFIKDTLNTGLYIDGELEINAYWGSVDDSDPLNVKYDNGTYTTTVLTNEFNIGLVTNPIEWFEGYFGFIMKNENEYLAEVDVPGLDKKALPSILNNKFGIKLGTTFIYKCVSFDLNWIGWVGNFGTGVDLNNDKPADWDWGDNGPFSHEITFTVGVALE
ncbi:MAG: hypothetical protein IKQ61_07220 [Spirochaetales bacterium]|nr:hypothetical protein [Spirochaetales bacterium]